MSVCQTIGLKKLNVEMYRNVLLLFNGYEDFNIPALDYIKCNQDKSFLQNEDGVRVVDLFLSICFHRQFLQDIVLYFYSLGGRKDKSDLNSLIVLKHLLLSELNNANKQDVIEILEEERIEKVVNILKFLLKKNIVEYLFSTGNRYFEESYVTEKITSIVDQNQAQLKEILKIFTKKLQQKREQFKISVTQPISPRFNTVPRVAPALTITPPPVPTNTPSSPPQPAMLQLRPLCLCPQLYVSFKAQKELNQEENTSMSQTSKDSYAPEEPDQEENMNTINNLEDSTAPKDLHFKEITNAPKRTKGFKVQKEQNQEENMSAKTNSQDSTTPKTLNQKDASKRMKKFSAQKEQNQEENINASKRFQDSTASEELNQKDIADASKRKGSISPKELDQEEHLNASTKGNKCSNQSSNYPTGKNQHGLEVKTVEKKPLTKQIPSVENKTLVRKNVATILREAARVIQEEEKEIQKVNELVRGAAHLEKYEDFLEMMKAKEEKQQIDDIKRKHLLGLLSREEARLAKQLLIEARKAQREQFDQERKQTEEALKGLKFKNEEKSKQIIHNIQQVKQHIEEKRKLLITEKQKIVQDVINTNRQLYEQELAKQREDLENRLEIIRQIKALADVKDVESQKFDPTETKNLGLLTEMSLAELRERLMLKKISIEEDIKNRQQILRKQRLKEKQFLQDTEEFIESCREQKKFLNLIKNDKSQKLKEYSESKDVLELREKLNKARSKRIMMENTKLIAK